MTVVRNNAQKVKLSGITALVETLKTVDTNSPKATLNKHSFTDNNGKRISYYIGHNKSKRISRKR